MIVLDTSVIIKWFVSEEYDYIAEEIRERFLLGKEDVSIPEFSLIELANVLVRKQSFNSNITKDAVKSIVDIGVNIIVPTFSIYESAIEIASDFDVSVYDSVFIAIAKELECSLITADDKLVKKIPTRYNVKALKDILKRN